jgi:Lrp/AsnC family leucine-responsive transcriptional regulator
VLDKIDREIIETLRADARMSYREIGERVFLSPNAVSERVRHLVESGVIQGFEARIDPQALDLRLEAIIDVKLSAGTTAAQFEAGLRDLEGVVEALLVTGSFDYMLRVACRDQDALVNLTETMRARGGVQETYTRVLMRRVRFVTRLA